MKIGIIGSGQLARMLILAGIPMGFSFVTYSPDESTSMGKYAAHIVGQYDDETGLKKLLDQVDVVTYEHENLPVGILKNIEANYPLRPGSKAIATVQDRLSEKQCFNRLTIPTNEYRAIDSVDDARQAAETLGFPFIIKTRRNGYDGKNQWRIESTQDIDTLISEEHCKNCIAEAFVDFDREVSIIAARNVAGQTDCYDISENKHRQGILHTTLNRPNDSALKQAYDYAQTLMTDLDYVGVIAIEFFEKNGQLLANEVAPRVHNSGHWTIEGARTSQFENHLRAISAQALGNCNSTATVRMDNCIGEIPAFDEILSNPNAHYHNYEKTPRPGRKLGHITTYIS